MVMWLQRFMRAAERPRLAGRQRFMVMPLSTRASVTIRSMGSTPPTAVALATALSSTFFIMAEPRRSSKPRMLIASSTRLPRISWQDRIALRGLMRALRATAR